jgi:hypothetical protein
MVELFIIYMIQINQIKSKKSMHCKIFTTLIAIMTTFSASSSEIPMKKLSEVMEVKKLSEFAVIPTRGSQYAAGLLIIMFKSVSFHR